MGKLIKKFYKFLWLISPGIALFIADEITFRAFRKFQEIFWKQLTVDRSNIALLNNFRQIVTILIAMTIWSFVFCLKRAIELEKEERIKKLKH